MKKFTSKTQKIGEKGEEIAVKFLKDNKFCIVDRNVSNKYGEIDIVAKKNKTIYFFEVKSGYVDGFINPAENFTKTKLNKFFKSVQYFCFKESISDFRANGIIVRLRRDERSEVEIIDLN